MSYFERMKLQDTDGNTVNPASEDGIRLLRRIVNLLKPLGLVAANTNRLQVEPVQATAANLNATVSIAAAQTLGTVTTVTTVTTMTNAAQIGSIPAFDLMKATSRASYARSVRQNLLFT
jgi:hypothetical protein